MTNPVSRDLFEHKYAMAILLLLHNQGAVLTTGLVRQVGGHPSTVIGTLRSLETLHVVSRTRAPGDRRAIEVRLTVKGLELVETAMSRWGRVLRKWDRLR